MYRRRFINYGLNNIMATIGLPIHPVVDEQLLAYNAHDINRFLSCYSDDIEIYDFPSTLKAKGMEQMRALYEPYMTGGVLHGQVLGRIVMGDTVVDLEKVDVNLPDGLTVLDVIGIYELQEGKIKKLTFIHNDAKIIATLGLG